MPKEILLIGHSGFYNRGCEAIVRGTIAAIRKYLPDSNITLLSRNAEYDAARLTEGRVELDIQVPVIKGAKKHSLKWLIQTFNRRIVHMRAPFDNIDDYLARSYFKKADAVVSIGGDTFSDDYGGPARRFASLDIARRYGAKTIIWAASIGPFRDKVQEQIWAAKLRMCELITVRESRTMEYLTCLGVTDNIHKVADPAFLLDAREPITNYDSSFFETRPIIGVGMSALFMRQDINWTTYIDTFVGFLKYLRMRYNASFLFVPHVIGEGPATNDMDICIAVSDCLGHNFEYWMIPSDYNACEMKYCIAKCDYFIGARTHSTIASLSSSVPTISVGYSVKAWGINEEILGSARYVIDYRNVTVNSLIELFEKLKSDESEIRHTLQSQLPVAQMLAMENARYLSRLI